MQDPILEKLRKLLPELYDPLDKSSHPAGLCTPEAGCGPDRVGSRKDLLRVIKDSVARGELANKDPHKKS